MACPLDRRAQLPSSSPSYHGGPIPYIPPGTRGTDSGPSEMLSPTAWEPAFRGALEMLVVGNCHKSRHIGYTAARGHRFGSPPGSAPTGSRGCLLHSPVRRPVARLIRANNSD